jgi:hypothetical protein
MPDLLPEVAGRPEAFQSYIAQCTFARVHGHWNRESLYKNKTIVPGTEQFGVLSIFSKK